MAGETSTEPTSASSPTAPGSVEGAPGVVVAGAETPPIAQPRPGDTEPLKKARGNLLHEAAAAFLPNRAVSGTTLRVIIAIQAGIALLIWLNSPFKVLPRPMEVLQAIQSLWMTQGLGPELITSFRMNLEALGWTVLISLALSYLTVLPAVRPLVAAISKGRFLSLVGFTLVFTLVVGGGRPLKVSLLVFGMSVFFVTSMAAVVAAIPKADFDHARTLRMSEWRVVWEVVILGTAATAFEVLRQNAAIGWMMLTMVEGISRSEGGVGAMLLNQSKHFHLSEVFAIQALILVVGMLQDYGIGILRRLCCPYADLTLERRGG
jgi:NitT/TauT family transport system permease protein